MRATLTDHPLARGAMGAALLRIFAFQIATRLRHELVWPWFEGAKLVVSRGMRAASGNIYVGLMEYQEMGFFLHFLRPGDLFFDLGANVGTYSVLASRVCGARTFAVEPDPDTLRQLRRNIEVNGLGAQVEIAPFALSDHAGVVRFWTGWDTSNRIATEGDGHATQEVPCRRLDDLVTHAPLAIKMDLEGGEEKALLGARQILASSALQALATEMVSDVMLELLAAAGFERVYYDPATRALTREPNNLRVADSLFVRDLEFCRDRLRQAPRRRVAGRTL